jgi:hypothetical protein
MASTFMTMRSARVAVFSITSPTSPRCRTIFLTLGELSMYLCLGMRDTGCDCGRKFVFIWHVLCASRQMQEYYLNVAHSVNINLQELKY